MRTLKTISISAAACIASLMLFSCNEEPKTTDPATFSIDQDTVYAKAEGGTLQVKYTLSNAQDGLSVQPDTKADWINGLDASQTGVISFVVSENTDTASREADVNVTYGDLQDGFKVIQEGTVPDEPEEPKAFDITIDEVSANSFTMSIIPEDKEITYDYGGISVADLNTLPDDETFVTEFLIPSYEQLAAANNMTLEALLTEILSTGDQTGLTVSGLAAETDYYAYAVGLSTSGEMTTEFVKVQFTSEPLGTFDATLEVTVDGPDAVVKVIPADETEGWYQIVFDGQGHANADMIASAQGQIEGTIQLYGMFGMPREDIVDRLRMFGTQEMSYELKATSDYTAAAFTIDANGYISSNPAIKEFATDEVAMSDNQISMDITSNNGRRVEYTVNTTNNDPYVFFTYQYTGTWTEMTDQQIIDYILENEDVSNYTRRGSVSTYNEGLRQQTDFMVFAFGIDGGVVTTELFRMPFTTAEATPNDLKFSYDYGPYYNGDEAAAKYPDQLASAVGKIVFPASYQVDEYYGIWHAIYLGDLTDKTAYPDEDVYQALRVYGNTWLSTTMIYILDPDQIYTACGFVEARDGSFGEIYRQIVGPFTFDGCSPIDDFVLDNGGGSLFSQQNFECPLRTSDNMSTIEPAYVKQVETMQMGLSTEKETAPSSLKAVEVEDVVIYNNLSSRL